MQSVVNAMRFIGCDTKIIQSKEELMAADGAILPGVGAFGDAMCCLRESGLVQPIKDFMSTNKPFLGICIGLQMLFDESEESPGVPGLGIFPGKVCRIPADRGRKVPHVGWNSLNITATETVFQGMPQDAYVYFVHSYYVKAAQQSIVTAQTQYGVTIDAAVGVGNIFATQFHPEKSGEVGLQILRNFIKIVKG